MINLTLVLLFLAAVGLIFIMVLVLFRTKKKFWNKIFILLNVALFCWIVADMFYSQNRQNIFFWSNITYSAALLSSFFYFIFSRSFLSPVKKSKITFLLFLPVAFFLFLILVKPEFMVGGFPPALSFGLLYPFYIVLIAGYTISSYIILIRKILVFKDIQRTQIKFIFFGSLLPSLAAFTGALILPIFHNYQLYFISPVFTLILSVSIAYAIFKHHLFDIKVITTEIFAVLIPLILLIDVYLSKNSVEFFWKGAVLVIVSIFSVFLVRGVFKEIEAKEVLIKLNQAKTEFLNIASHQLRTPVSVIKGTVSMMKEGDLEKLPPEKKAMFIEGLWQKSKKLESIVSDILNASEMSSDKYRLIDKKAAPIDVINMLKKVIEEAQFEAQERQTEVKLVEPSQPLPTISGQEEYLKEAIGNLLDNAIKYTPSIVMNHEARDKRETPGIISLFVKQDNENVIIAVKDNGIGVPKNEAANIFKKFQRASNARNMYTDGSGLGLFIVKEIVEGHGGRVWFESQMGKGTTFYVSLPIKPLSEPDVKKYILEKQTVA